MTEVFSLPALQAKLDEHFVGLRDERGQRPVFLIEHGLKASPLLGMQNLVGRHFSRFGVAGFSHYGFSLPLATVISEIGYTYQGTGTDFWPKVSDALNADIQISERTEISQIFKALSQKYNFARPLPSDWSKAYSHIAWPIRNALAPREIHAPLFRALRQVLASGTYLKDDTELLLSLREIAAGLWSKRLDDWLQDGELALDLTRRLLAADQFQSFLEPGITGRITDDLHANPGTRGLLRSTRRIASRERLSITSPDPGIFRLSIVRGAAERLLLQGPKTPEVALNRALTLIGYGSGVVPETGTGRSIGLDVFLSGGILDLGQPRTVLPNPALTVLSDVPETDAKLKFVGELQPEQSLFFLYSNKDGIVSAVSPDIPLSQGQSLIHLLWLDEEVSEVFPEIGCWDEAKAIVLNPEMAEARQYLEHRGFTFSEKEQYEFGGGISLAVKDGKLSSISGLPIIFRSQEASSISVQNDMGELMVSREVKGSSAVPISLAPGEYSLEVSLGSSRHMFDISIHNPPEYVPFSIELEPEAPDIDEFHSGNLDLSIVSPVPLENIPIEAKLFLNGHVVAKAGNVLPTAPSRLGCDAGLLKTLRETVMEGSIPSSNGYLLQVSVPGLCQHEWFIAPVKQAYEYRPHVNSWYSDTGEGPFRTLAASFNSILPDASDSRVVENVDEILLISPDNDEDNHLTSAQIIVPTPLRLEKPEINLPSPRLRSAKTTDAGYGAIQIFEALVTWKYARTTNMFADRKRIYAVHALESALVHQLCGENWLKIEERGGGLKGNAYDALVSICFHRELVVGPGFPELAPEDYPLLNMHLKTLFEKAIPDFFTAIPSGDAAFEALDFAINDAYELLGQDRQSRGDEAFEEQDAGNTPEDWRAALQDAKVDAEKPLLKPLILPENRWLRLSRLDYSTTTKDGIVDALSTCHQDSSRRPGVKWISRRELRTGLQIWLSPRDIINSFDWCNHIERLLSDRQTSRAIRYTALRYRADKT